MEVKSIRKKDYKKAIGFAIKGMHFNWYLDSKFLLSAYGRYFWYLELNRATQIFAAYAEDKLVGILLAEFKDEPRMTFVGSVIIYSYLQAIGVIHSHDQGCYLHQSLPCVRGGGQNL